jgi:hypothetical protein
MAMPEAESARFTDEQVRDILGPIKGADGVELKLTVPDEDRRSTVVALGLDPLDAYLRQIYFFDTLDLALDRAGIVTRARRSQNRADDSVVKLRPVVPSELPSKIRKSKWFAVEVDAMPGGFVCSASFKGKCEPGAVAGVVCGDRPIRSLLSDGQRGFLEEYAPDSVALDQLVALGPVTVMKLKGAPEGYDRKLVAELWLYPDGGRILELSTKCKPDEAFDVAAMTRAYLSERGVNLSGKQQTKTRAALEYFRGP